MAKARKNPADDETKAGGRGASKELLKQALADFKYAEDWWGENRKKWLEDARFRVIGEGNQWPEKIKKAREAAGLPIIEVDKLNQYVKQVVNDGRQNRPAVKVRPVDSGADIKVADKIQGLIRHICVRSNADEAFDTALDHAVGNGFGYFRVLADFVHDRAFTQDLVVRRIPNAMAVLLSPHELADGSDTRFGFVIEEVPKESFKSRWPKAKVTNWQSEAFKDGWCSDKTVRVCEYYYKVETETTLYYLADGTSATAEEYEAAEIKPEIIDERPYRCTKVKWCRMTAAEILEENDWLGKYIPIIPVYGNESNVEGKVIYSGLIRPAKDPQRLHNYSRAAFATRVGLATKATWLAAAEQIADYAEDWEQAHTGNVPVLRYKHLAEDGSVIPPPIRINPTDVPAGFAQDAQMSEHDIQGALGMYNASLGERSNEKSGRAIMARQREGDTATFHYQDNLNRAIRYLGMILVDAAPKYYDTRRVQRILGEDGKADNIQLDPEQKQAVVENGKESIYNLGIGTYDVTVEAGPSYTTRRVEAAEAMMEMVKGNPAMWQTHGDLIAKTQDWPGSEEWAKRSRAVMPPPLQQAIAAEEEDVDPAVALMQQQMQALQQQLQEIQGRAQQALGQAQQQLEQLKTDKALDAKKLDIEAYKAETERMQALAPAIAPEQIVQIVQQTVAAIMAQPVPTQDPPANVAPPPPIEQMPPPMAAPEQDQPPDGGFFTPGA